jgi:hypothetical protein
VITSFGETDRRAKWLDWPKAEGVISHKIEHMKNILIFENTLFSPGNLSGYCLMRPTFGFKYVLTSPTMDPPFSMA